MVNYKDNIYCEWAPKKVAMEVAWALGARALVAMKHVGLNVHRIRFDSMYTGVKGGLE